MTTVQAAPAPERLRRHLQVPLHRAGYALVANAALTSVLGLAYWAVAARSYPPAAVGAAAGLLAALQVVANVAQLGFRNALVRFVPSVGEHARRLVAGAYLLSGTAAALGALAFALVHDRWVPELALLAEPAGVALFVGSAALWMVFILQDSALVGARRAGWVPVENLVYGALKLLALVAVAGSLPDAGIFLSWVAPLLVLVAVVNVALFRRLLPRLGRRAGAERLTGRDLLRFTGGDYAGSLLWHTTLDLMPLVVIALAGADGGAYYALAWTIAYSLYLVPSGVGSALVAEAAHAPGEHAADTHRALRQSLLLVVPAALALALVAPLVLRVLGSAYEAEATTLLRVLALSAIPHVITSIHVSRCRARRQVGSLVRLYAWFAVGVLGGGALLVTVIGPTGAGLAWLAVQTVTASALALTSLRPVVVAGLPTRMLRALGALASLPARRSRRRRARALLPALVDGLRHQGLLGPTVTHRLVKVGADEAVIAIGDVDGPPLIAKLAFSERAAVARAREHEVLAHLAAADWLPRTRTLVPRPVGVGTANGRPYVVETAAPGRDGTAVSGPAAAELVRAGLVAVDELHQLTAEVVVVDDALVDDLVRSRAAIVAASVPGAGPGLAAVVDELTAALSGRVLQVAFGHGDLHPGNLILDGEPLRVTGLVDWGGARNRTLPELDVACLAISTRAGVDHREVGAVVAELVDGAADPVLDDALAGRPSWSHNQVLGRRAVVLLAWLDHVATNLDKAGTYAASEAWVARNVLAVTGHLAPRSTPVAVGPAAQPAAAPTTDDPVIGGEAPPPPPEPTARRPRPDRALGRSVPALGRSVPALGLSVAALVVGAALWALGFLAVDPRAIGDLGVVSELPPSALAGLALLVAGFGLVVGRRPWRDGLGAAHVVALAACLHAVPAAAYETLRYSWAWKHLGIIDYIARTGTVDPSIATGDAYHNWPGFFAATQALSELAGVDPFVLARWAPAVFGVLTALAVAFLLAGLTEDRRVVWTGTWFAVLANWVGQEYFSPQATAFVLYLVALGLAVRLRGPTPWRGRAAVGALLVVVVLAAAVAASHQLTPAALTIALVGVAVAERGRLAALALAAATLTVGWALWGADTFVQAEVLDELAALGAPVDNATESLVDPSRISAGQQLVSLAGRAATLAVTGVALVGLVGWWRRRPRDPVPVWLLAVPLPLLVLSGYGGEVVLRVLLFASPLLGFFAARGLLGTPGRARLALRATAVGVASLVLLGGFLLAHYGKDGHYVFSNGEVAAAAFIADRAPEGTLLVEGSQNYPKQSRNYERFRYVSIEREPEATQRRIARRPVATMVDWMGDDRDAAAYLLVTRSMKEELAAQGIGPEGLLDRLETALRASPRFRVAFEAPDAVVFQLADR